MIAFNEPVYTEKGIDNITEAIRKNKRLNGDGPFTAKCTEWFETKCQTRVLLTTSCTHALEMAVLLADIKEGDYYAFLHICFYSKCICASGSKDKIC